MKARPYGILALVGIAILLAPPAAGQCEGALSFGSFYTGSGAGIPTEIYVVTRPDTSNPGARALALGGAFIATADDSTSVVANPAGLGASVKPGVQVEVRYNPTVQFDHVSDEGLQDPSAPGEFTASDSSLPYFVSGVVPVGDRLVLGAFYQTVFTTTRTVDRIGDSSRTNAACFKTVNSRGSVVDVYVPLYELKDDTTIYRTGASAAYRLSTGLSIGATVYYAKEDRDQTYKGGDLFGNISIDPFNPTGRVVTNSSKVGFEIGAQYSPSENLRFGAVWASDVEFDYPNVPGSSSLETVRNTIIPMKIGAGLSWTAHPRWSVGMDFVYLQTSAEGKALNFQYGGFVPSATDPRYWKTDDTTEIRVGLEWTALQTPTTLLSVRFGGWYQNASGLRFDNLGEQIDLVDRPYHDALGVIFPKEDDPYVHATFGLGLVTQKRWQFDVGVDYEFKTETLVGSALLGYTF